MAAMGSFNSFAAFFVVAVIAIFSVTASAQDFEMAPAQPPSMDTGSAYSLPISGAIVCASVVLSLLALMKH
ncbi:Meiosis arrest female protein [Actinidia chinensis var. chinensis]|uniref:Meiosis arrest female protein n=1 Tax=Actinidia chinensis var. chinensis TaxID=1590841 RepID=A0A2R6QKT0_ACTCC|nr:Meiosis arrest female protein [Actinidia chinensis var. chinensis]